MTARMQLSSRRLGTGVAAVCLSIWVACSAQPQTITVGYRESEVGTSPLHDAGAAGAKVPQAGSFAPQAGAGAAGTAGLGVQIAMSDVMVQLITLACDAGCAEVRAVASGGNPPYEYVWDDGTQGATRKLCADTPGKHSVKVTDTALEAMEFSYSSQTVFGEVTTQVSACRGSKLLCIENPSFEGMAALNVPAVPAFDGAPWLNCNLQSPDILNETVLSPDVTNINMLRSIPASAGSTYLVMYDMSEPNTLFECVSQALCEPLQAGQEYNLTVDLAFHNAPWFFTGNGQGNLEIWGGSGPGLETEKLWTSPLVGHAWQTYCAKLKPTQNYPYLTLRPAHHELTAGIVGTGVFVDNIVPVQSCGM